MLSRTTKWILFFGLFLSFTGCGEKVGERYEAAPMTLQLRPFSGGKNLLSVKGEFPTKWNRTGKAHEVRFWSKASESGRLGQLLVGYYSCGDCNKEVLRNLLISALQQEVEKGTGSLPWEIVQEVGEWKNGAVGFVLRTEDVVNKGHWYKFVVDHYVPSKEGTSGYFLRCTGDVGLKLQESWVEIMENCFQLELTQGPKK